MGVEPQPRPWRFSSSGMPEIVDADGDLVTAVGNDFDSLAGDYANTRLIINAVNAAGADANESAARNALVRIATLAEYCAQNNWREEVSMVSREALATPCRNCDRPECRTEAGARKAYHDEVGYTTVPGFERWLFMEVKPK